MNIANATMTGAMKAFETGSMGGERQRCEGGRESRDYCITDRFLSSRCGILSVPGKTAGRPRSHFNR
jgi:hypothetical protein